MIVTYKLTMLQRKTPKTKGKSHVSESVEATNANEGVDDLKIDAIIEEMLASFDDQPSQEQ